MINLAGKTAVVFGLANKRSIAWGIAQRLHEAGATLAICYQNERMRLEAQSLIDELPGAFGFQCDVSNDAEIEKLFAGFKEQFGKVEILVHAVAFAPPEDLRGAFTNTTREGFRIAMDVSVSDLSSGTLYLTTTIRIFMCIQGSSTTYRQEYDLCRPSFRRHGEDARPNAVMRASVG